MPNSNSEPSPSEPSEFRPSGARVPVVIAIILVIVSGAASRPLAAKLTHRALLHARQSSQSAALPMGAGLGIRGQIVDSQTGAPISGGTVTVALEQPDGTGTDVVFTQESPDASGHFSFARLPLATSFDVVAVAVSGSGTAYNATVVVGVPAGSNVGAIPLIAETGGATGLAKIEGFVTAAAPSGPSTIRATVSAIQTIDLIDGISVPVNVPQTVTLAGASTRPITIPGEPGTSANVLVQSSSACPAAASRGVNCASYMMMVPGSNPSVALFGTGKISYGSPAAGPAVYSVRANSYMPGEVGGSVCIPSFQSVTADAAGKPLQVSSGGTATAQPIAFTGCW